MSAPEPAPARAAAAQATLGALTEQRDELRTAYREALSEAVRGSGATVVATTLGITRSALYRLLRPADEARRRVPPPAEPPASGWEGQQRAWSTPEWPD